MREATIFFSLVYCQNILRQHITHVCQQNSQKLIGKEKRNAPMRSAYSESNSEKWEYSLGSLEVRLAFHKQFSGVYRCAEANALWCGPKVYFVVARMVRVAVVCMVCCLLKLAWRILLLQFLPWHPRRAGWAETEVSTLPPLYCKNLRQNKLFLPKDSWVNLSSLGKKKMKCYKRLVNHCIPCKEQKAIPE